MSLKITQEITQRGFVLLKFKDSNNVQCSLQESSRFENSIWLGCDDADPRTMDDKGAVVPVEMPKEYLANTRMHLTQMQVKELLPLLKVFADTGYLPQEERLVKNNGEANTRI